MKFIDMVNIYVVAGKGGDGIISFRREKFIPKGGPDGGNGGSGGNIWLKTSNNLNTLVNFNFKKIFFSQSGKNGNNNNKTGKNGKDLYIIVPIGTRVIDQNKNKTIINLLYNKQLFLLAKGGKPGIGNNKFKNSINRTPMKRTLGLKGEKKNIKLELFLLANVGTLGLPNAGKSTFINIISSAKSKISCYPFTTLSPKLGLVKFNKKKKFIIADIPGIIKNCSKGIGLGINFLKHLTHCNLLLHIIDISSQNINIIIKNIINIQNELKNYNYNLYKKKRWLIFNKIDLINNKNFIKLSFKIINKLNWNNKHFIISSKKNFGINELCFNIIKKIYKKNEKKKIINTMTSQGAEKLRQKLDKLKNIKRPYIIKLLSSSRKNGDLKENSEYHAAKEEQSFCENKIREIENKLANANIIDIHKIKHYNKIIFGIPFTILKIDNNKIFNYIIVGKDEADPKKNMISINSPISRSLIGKSINKIIKVNTPNGKVKYKILKIGK